MIRLAQGHIIGEKWDRALTQVSRAGDLHWHAASLPRLPEQKETCPPWQPLPSGQSQGRAQSALGFACPDSDGTSQNTVPAKASQTQSKQAQSESDTLLSFLILNPTPSITAGPGDKSDSQVRSHLSWPGWWDAVEPSDVDGDEKHSRPPQSGRCE